MSKKFTTSAKARTAIEFELDGVNFTFRPPKSAAMVMPLLEGGADDVAVIRAGLDWLKQGLDEDQYAIIAGRMKDPEDDYDLEDFEDLVDYLVEQAANDRPIL